MDLVWLVCLRPLGCHLLNFFEIPGREFRSSAAKLRPKANIGKFPRRPVFVSAFDAPARRCAGKTSFFAPIYLTLMKVSTIRRHSNRHIPYDEVIELLRMRIRYTLGHGQSDRCLFGIFDNGVPCTASYS